MKGEEDDGWWNSLAQKAWRRSRVSWHSAAVATSAFVCYYNALGGDLVFDDVAAIKDNRDLRPRTPLANLFLNDFWGTPIHKEESHKSYRPLCTLTFRLNFALHGLDPFGYHLVNVLLHCLVCVLLYRLCLLFLPSKASFVASMLFAVHPIHTEAVSGVVGRAEVLSALFYLCALNFYIRRTAGASEAGGLENGVPVILAILGTLCKEQCLTVLPVCAIYELALSYRKSWKLKPWKMLSSERLRPLLPAFVIRLGVLAFGVFVIALGRFWIMGSTLPVFSRFDNPARLSSLPTRPLTYHFLLALNSWLLLCPSSLCCDWTMGSVPLVQKASDPRNLATLAFYAVLVGLVWCLVNSWSVKGRGERKRCIVVTMGLAMMVLPFLPASNLLFSVGFVVAERVLYLPSMGFCVLVGYGWHRLSKKHRRRPLQVQMTLLLLCLSMKTVHRNFDWKSEQSLFASALTVNQRNPKLFNNYGRALENVGKHEEALLYYRKSMSLQPDDIRSYLNSGKALTYLGRHHEAEEMFLQAKSLLPSPNDPLPLDLRITSSHLQVFLNLATLIARNHSRLKEADEIFREALSFRSDYTEAYISRGELLLRMNKTKDAEVMYAKAIHFEGTNPDLYNNYGLVLLDTGRSDEALTFFTKALDIDPEHENTLLNLALFVQESRSPSARQIALDRLQAVANQSKQNETLYFRLGMSSLEHKDKPAAENWFRRAIEIQPTFRSALYNLALLLSEQERPAEALPVLRQLLKYHENHTKGLLLLGDMYFNYLKNLDGAQKCYERLLRVDPDNAQGQHNLCVVILERGDLLGAERCFVSASHQHPDLEYIRNHLQLTRSLLTARSTAMEESKQIESTREYSETSTKPRDVEGEDDYRLSRKFSVQ